MRSLTILLISAIFAGFLSGCSSTPDLDTSTPEGAYALAEKYDKDERFEEAITQYGVVKNKHPYSKLATEAELKIAEIHFKREDFIEAQSAYQTFKELHPTHPKTDYVTFRMGLSLYMQLPGTIDRDLGVAERSILYFDEVVQSYPASPHVGEAKEYKQKALKMLAEKEYYIGHFYFIRDFYLAALGRFEDMLDKYPTSDLAPQALYGASVSAYKVKELAKAKTYYRRLTTEFKDSKEAGKARSELGNSI